MGLRPDPWRRAREAGAPCLVPRGVVSSARPLKKLAALEFSVCKAFLLGG